MSAATVSINLKLPDQTLVQVGGVGYDDFYQNLLGFLDATAAEDVVAVVRKALVPVSAGAPAPYVPTAQRDEPQGYQAEAQALQAVQNAFPQAQVQQQAAPPSAVPNCPNHQQPARWVAPGVSKVGKPYQGFFACAVSQRGDNSCRIPR